MRLRYGRLNSGGLSPNLRTLGYWFWCGKLRLWDIDWNSVNWLGGKSPLRLLRCWNPRLRDADWDSFDGLSGKPPMRLLRRCERLRNIDLDIFEGFGRRLGSGRLKLFLEGNVLIRIGLLGRTCNFADSLQLLARRRLSFRKSKHVVLEALKLIH